MYLTCSRDSLLNAINIVSKAVSNRTTLPILECILLKCEEDSFKLTANDLELGIETSPIEADVQEEGSVAIEAKLFSEIIRRVNGDSVKISTSENEAKISCGNSEFTISINSSDEFPAIPVVSKEKGYKIKQKELKDMINGTIFSIATDESKPVLTGELIEIKSGTINVVGVDGYRISFRKSEVSSSSSDIKVIVPGKTLREITKILSSEEDEEAAIYVTDKHILFDLSGNIIVSRLIEGEYIKYEQTFTDEFKTRVIVNCSDMTSSLERASLISRDAKKIPVKLEILKDKIVITSRTDIGNVYEEVFCETEGDELKIAFNPKYLIDALKVCDDDKVEIHFNSSLSPCIIKPEDGDSYKYLILPLRM